MSASIIFQLLVLFGVLFLFLFLKFPVFLSMGLSLASYYFLFPGKLPLSIIGQGIISGISDQNFVAVCFYFLLGDIMSHGSLGDRLVEFLQACVGHIHGSMAHVNILSSMVFAGISGSSVADTASVGGMSLNAMKKAGFPADFSAAVTACSAIIGPVIPPSTGLVLMAVYFHSSVRQMFLGGLIPGVLMGLFEIAIAYYLSKKRGYPCTEWAGWKNVLVKGKRGFAAFLLPAIVIGCLMAGIGTVVEIGALACLVAVGMEIFYKEITPKKLLQMVMRITVMSASLLALLSISGVYTWILSSMGVANWMAGQITLLGVTPAAVVSCIVIFLLILGFVLPVAVIQMVVIPVMVPVLTQLGVNAIWFGVIAVLVMQIGTNTPPVGTLIYVSASIAGCNSADVVKQDIPFIVGLVALVALMIACPAIVTWLPTMLI